MDVLDDAGLTVHRVEGLSWKWYAGENAIYASECVRLLFHFLV
jgi:hypothetical protein